VVETWDLTARPIDMLVGFSNEEAGRSAAGYFLERGRRRPAIVLASDERAKARRSGFVGKLEEAGAPLAGEVRVDAPSTVADGRQALRTLLERPRAPDAIFCSSNQLAVGVLFEAAARGIPVPERLAIMGFGNNAIAEQTNPPLTVLSVDGGRIGRESARSLLDAIARAPGRRRTRPRTLDVGFTILPRGTT